MKIGAEMGEVVWVTLALTLALAAPSGSGEIFFFNYCKDSFCIVVPLARSNPRLDKKRNLGSRVFQMDPADMMVEAKSEIRSRIVGLSLSSKVCEMYFYRGSSFLDDN